MKLTSVWVATGLMDGRIHTEAHVVADTFEEAARLASEALRYGWGVQSAPPVEIVSVALVHEDVRLDG